MMARCLCAPNFQKRRSPVPMMYEDAETVSDGLFDMAPVVEYKRLEGNGPEHVDLVARHYDRDGRQ